MMETSDVDVIVVSTGRYLLCPKAGAAISRSRSVALTVFENLILRAVLVRVINRM